MSATVAAEAAQGPASRLDAAVHGALARWASDELRSTNAQIEFLLRRALDEAGRPPRRHRFAGNAALAAACDVIIATPEASLGMGGPAMIEGGGLGVVAPDEVGPMSVQVPNGVVDLLVPDEGAAVAAARRYLSYFPVSVLPGDAPHGEGSVLERRSCGCARPTSCR